jgi:hypothetical protein
MASTPANARQHLFQKNRRVSWSEHLARTLSADSPPPHPAAVNHVPDREEFGWLLGDDEPAPPAETIMNDSAISSSVWRDAFAGHNSRYGQGAQQSRLERSDSQPWDTQVIPAPSALLATPVVRPWSNAQEPKLAGSAVLNGAGAPPDAPPPQQQAPRTQAPQQAQREAQREEDGRGQADHQWLVRGMERTRQVIQLSTSHQK